MARRIRSIKPEIIEDEKTGPLSDTAFRLFASMITIADDHGNVRADARWLQAQIWWAHSSPPNVLLALIELTKGKLIDIYGVRGGTYAHLRGWAKHQRVDNAGKSMVPMPTDAESQTIDLDAGQPGDGSPRVAASRREIPLDRIGEEGKGVSGKPDSIALLAEAAVAEINRLGGSRYQADSDSMRDLAKGLAKDHRTPEQVRAVIAFKAIKWVGDPKMGEQFKPSVLLRRSNFTKYLDDLNAAPQPKTLRLATSVDDEPEIGHLLQLGGVP